MSPVVLLLLAGVASLAFIASGVSGGGAGLVLLPVLGFALPISQVPLALTIGTTASAASRAVLLRRSVRWRMVLIFVPAALPFTFLGVFLLTHLQVVYIELALGVFLTGNLFICIRSVDVATDRVLSLRCLISIGAAAGFLSGLVGAVGLLFNHAYLRLGLRKEEIVATRAANEVLLHVTKFVLYLNAGLLTQDSLTVGLSVAAAAIVASFALRWLLPFLREHLFRRVSQVAMGAGGVLMAAGAGASIIEENSVSIAGRAAPHAIEATLLWGSSHFSIAVSPMKGLIFERKVAYETLPARVRRLADQLSVRTDRVVYEKVYLLLEPSSYELSGYRDGHRFTAKL